MDLDFLLYFFIYSNSSFIMLRLTDSLHVSSFTSEGSASLTFKGQRNKIPIIKNKNTFDFIYNDLALPLASLYTLSSKRKVSLEIRYSFVHPRLGYYAWRYIHCIRDRLNRSGYHRMLHSDIFCAHCPATLKTTEQWEWISFVCIWGRCGKSKTKHACLFIS